MANLVDYNRGGPLMIWGGGSGKSGEKNSTATRVRKKTQLNNLEEKKTQLNNLEEKKNSTVGWPGKKTQPKFSARAPPPSLMVRPLIDYAVA